MKKFARFWGALAATTTSLTSIALAQPGTFPAQKAPVTRTAAFKNGELLVKFGAGPASLTAHNTNVKIGAHTVKTFGFIGWQKVQLPKTLSVEEAAALYRKQPGVLAVSPNYIYHASKLPNDTRYGELYGMTKIGAPAAWDKSTGSATTVVAVIDSGVDYTHEDLAANMWRNPGESGGGKESNGLDDDKDGYVDDVFGIDAANADSNPFDDNEHGTHCAGTIGAVGNNAKGVVGVNWNVKIMALKFLDSNGNGTEEGAIECLHYTKLMKDKGVNIRVTNNSWGGGGFSQALKDAFDAAGSAGILNTVAASNEGTDNDAVPSYPGNFDSPSIIVVSASDSSDARAGFSNYGASSVDIAAPGVGILSTVPGTGTYGLLSGTSMATPHVTGAAALLASYYSGLGVADLKTLLMAGVDHLTPWQGLVVSGGRLNLARSLALGSSATPPVVGEALPRGELQPLRPAIEVSFTHAMNTASVQSAFRVSPNVAGAFAWSNGNKTVKFTPAANFAGDTVVTAKILGSAADTTGKTLDGNANGTAQGTPSDDYVWTFRTSPPPPPNDPFATPQVISGANGTVSGTNVNATLEAGEPDHAGAGSSHSVWYRWKASSSGTVQFTTAGSDFDTVLAVYTGSSLSSLTEIASVDDDGDSVTSTVTFNAVSGTTYSIAVAGYAGAQGTLTLKWTSVSRPANDDFANATALSGAYGSAVSNTSLATAQNSEPAHAESSATHSIWYRWTAPASGRFIFTTAGSGFDTVLAIYRGSALTALTTVASNDDIDTDGQIMQSAAGFTATSGTVYYIAIDGFNGASGASLLTWYGNDIFAAARTLSGNSGTVSGFNYAATKESGEVAHAGSLGASLWFKWKAPSSGQLSLATTNSPLDTVLSAYTGSALASLKSVGENDDYSGSSDSRISIPVTSGTVYYIALDGKSGAANAFHLLWDFKEGTANTAPSVVSVTPNGGTSDPGVARTFTTIASDADGAGDINLILFHIGINLNPKNELRFYYVANTNKLYLRDNASTTWLGGFAPGSNNVISNSQGKLNCAATTVEKQGNQLIVHWSITPSGALAGSTQNLYLYAKDRKAQYDGYEAMGTWQIGGNQAPVDISLNPSGGSTKQGVARDFATTYRDPNGARNISYVYFHIGPSTSTSGALRCYYNLRTNVIYVRNDADTAWLGGYAPGSNHIITTAKGSLDCAATSVTVSGTSLTVNWHITPTSAFVGNQNLYLFVRDMGALSDGWDDLGDWKITP